MLSFKNFIQEAKVINTNRRGLTNMVKERGWSYERAGGQHDIYGHPDFPQVKIAIPRHDKISPGVATKIDKQSRMSLTKDSQNQ